MDHFNGKEHTSKYMRFAKAAGEGSYPGKKVGEIGSKIGLGVGAVLCCVGIYSLTQNIFIGLGNLAAGILTIGSNIINLKRIK